MRRCAVPSLIARTKVSVLAFEIARVAALSSSPSAAIKRAEPREIANLEEREPFVREIRGPNREVRANVCDGLNETARRHCMILEESRRDEHLKSKWLVQHREQRIVLDRLHPDQPIGLASVIARHGRLETCVGRSELSLSSVTTLRVTSPWLDATATGAVTSTTVGDAMTRVYLRRRPSTEMPFGAHAGDSLPMKYRPQQTVPQLLNLSEAEARKLAEEMGLTVRVLRPGSNVLTTDLRHDRVNLVISLGRVTAAKVY